MNHNNKTYISLVLDNRVVRMGSYPNTKVRKYFECGRKSPLWHDIKQTMDNHYPNSTLEFVEARGKINGNSFENYKPEVRNTGFFRMLANGALDYVHHREVV